MPPLLCDRELIASIFNPLFTNRGNGMGPGPAVARRIAAAHGGIIVVGELMERGTSFTVILPLIPLNRPKAHAHGLHTGG